jgi:hypothetical protein
MQARVAGVVYAPRMTQPAPLRLAWPLPLEALVLGAAGQVGLRRHDLTPLAPWIARAAAAGPTPSVGPLAHELQLPNRDKPHELGLNVFVNVARTGRALTPFIADAERWAGHILGAAAAAAVASLPVAARGISWHGGARWDGSSWRLKLYGNGSAPDVAAAARSLGADLAHVELEAALVALGLDVTGSGIERVRSYERMELGSAPRGTSHRLLGRIGGARAKRSVLTRFAPGVPASALLGHAVDPDWLRALAASMVEAGFSLDATAHQLDLYEDGRRGTDVFVAVGTAGTPAG